MGAETFRADFTLLCKIMNLVCSGRVHKKFDDAGWRYSGIQEVRVAE